MPRFTNPLSLSLTAFSALSLALPSNQTIQWGPCEDLNTTLTQCGTLDVPLDYTDSSKNTTLTLQLTKFPATKQPSKGSILYNPGGPGENARTNLLALGEEMQVMSGGIHDIIGMETRGTGNTLPFICFDDINRLTYGIQRPSFINGSNTAFSELWALEKNAADLCYEKHKDTGRFVGTAFVARDMFQVIDALGEEKLNYWGFSYGTTLGATLAAMFPERIDKIVLDGVQNPHEYYHLHDLEQYTEFDRVLHDFFKACVDHSELCTLARPGLTAEQLEASFYDFLEDLKQNPINLDLAQFPQIPISAAWITYNSVKAQVINTMYSPSEWPTFANMLNTYMTFNTSAIAELTLAQLSAPVDDDTVLESNYAIKCGDNDVRSSNRSSILPAFASVSNISRFLSDFPGTFAVCPQWRFDAAERYKGDFHSQLKNNGMLIIGSEFDPYTPLKSAYNVSAGFEGSVVVEHQGYGHTSLGQVSLCTAKAVRNYFTNGTLPQNGLKCSVDVPLYSGLDWKDVLPGNMIKRAVDSEDRRLLGASVKLGKRMSRTQV